MSAAVIDRKGSRPLYEQVKDHVRERIADGEYGPGERIESERKLCGSLGVSQITVRQAFVDLTNEGVLVRQQGKGTFVAEHPLSTESACVGLVIPDSDTDAESPFVMGLLAGIKPVTADHLASLTVYTETEARYVVDACEGRLAGLIYVVPHLRDQTIPMLVREGIPLVVIGETQVTGAYAVDTDNEAVGRMAAAHFLESGRRRCGFIGGPRDFTVTAARLRGYRQTLGDAGLLDDGRLTRFGRFAGETGARHAPELAAQGADAVFCADDTIALGALNALHDQAVSIPDDVAVMGCNNSDFTRHAWPPLTTIDTFASKIGRTCAEVLVGVLRGDPVARCTLVDAALVVRESSRAVPKAAAGSV